MCRQLVGAAGRTRYERVNPARRYQTLRDVQESPVLPTGYAGMLLLALVPPLWRRVMDLRVVAHFGGDVSRANIQPARREAVLARWGAPAAPVEPDGRGDTTGSRPAPRGPTSRATGTAPTAGCARRPTSWPCARRGRGRRDAVTGLGGNSSRGPGEHGHGGHHDGQQAVAGPADEAA